MNVFRCRGTVTRTQPVRSRTQDSSTPREPFRKWRDPQDKGVDISSVFCRRDPSDTLLISTIVSTRLLCHGGPAFVLSVTTAFTRNRYSWDDGPVGFPRDLSVGPEGMDWSVLLSLRVSILSFLWDSFSSSAPPRVLP